MEKFSVPELSCQDPQNRSSVLARIWSIHVQANLLHAGLKKCSGVKAIRVKLTELVAVGWVRICSAAALLW
jgi:hypothetical protein